MAAPISVASASLLNACVAAALAISGLPTRSPLPNDWMVGRTIPPNAKGHRPIMVSHAIRVANYFDSCPGMNFPSL